MPPSIALLLIVAVSVLSFLILFLSHLFPSLRRRLGGGGFPTGAFVLLACDLFAFAMFLPAFLVLALLPPALACFAFVPAVPVSLSVGVSICLSVLVSFSPVVCLGVRLSVCVFVRLSVCVFARQSVCVCLRLSVCMFIRLSVCMFVRQSVFVYVSHPVRLTVCLSVLQCVSVFSWSVLLCQSRLLCLPLPGFL